jgi:hypothetical protein
MPGLVPGIPIGKAQCWWFGMAGTGPAMTQSYCSSGSRMNDFLSPCAATGRPYWSKPVFIAVSFAEPGIGVPSGWVSGAALACGAGVAGPGGNSSGPLRPQPASARTAIPAAANTRHERRRTKANSPEPSDA